MCDEVGKLVRDDTSAADMLWSSTIIRTMVDLAVLVACLWPMYDVTVPSSHTSLITNTWRFLRVGSVIL